MKLPITFTAIDQRMGLHLGRCENCPLMIKMVLETIVRTKNARFLLEVTNDVKVQYAAEIAGITPQHGSRLLNDWREAGIVERYIDDGVKYRATSRGNGYIGLAKHIRRIEEMEDAE